MRRARSVPALLVAALLLAAPAAHGLPGDAPFAPLSPADGASVTVDPAGIPVAWTCPVYRSSTAGEGFTVFGGPRDYSVGMATSAATDPDGRLAAASRVAVVEGSPEGESCTARLGAGGSVRPQEVPGTYFWQVWRLCVGCDGGYEVGPVRRLVLRSAARPVVRPVSGGYATYPVLVALGLDGVPDRTAVVVERRAGSRWVRAGSATALGGRGEAVVTFPTAGTVRLRGRVVLGDDAVTSAERAVAVRSARAPRTTGARDDGRYTGTGRDLRSIGFRVAGGGRELRGLRAFVAMTCPGVTAGSFTTQIGTATLARLRVAPDGRFVAAASPRAGTTLRVRGRLRGRRVTGGRVELSVGTCVGNTAFTAVRR